MTQSAAFVPEHAPLVALAFLAACGSVLLTLAGAAIFALRRRPRPARRLAAAGGAIAGLYLVLLLGLSLGSRDVLLAPGGRKYFCEIDCHLAYSIQDSARVSPDRVAVTVRAWFDQSTIAPWRGDALLAPNPKVAWLVDANGRRYPALPAGAGGSGLDRPLKPGEASTARLLFRAPAGAASRLLLVDPPGIENLLLSHENSPFHGKVYLELPRERGAQIPYCPAGAAGRKCAREAAAGLRDDAAQVGRVLGRGADRQRAVLPGPVSGSVAAAAAPAVPGGSGPRARFRLLRGGLRSHPPGSGARPAQARRPGKVDVVRGGNCEL